MAQFDKQSLPNKFGKKELKKKSDNMSDWYTDVVQKAELADYGPVKGTMVIRPYGYAIWENVQKIMDGMFKTDGVQNAYFPLFIPYSLMQKEKEHVAGFSPELALVTHAGGEELKEPLAVRPTSETIMYEMYAKWIHSWRDLPMKINQWNNVVRWEKRTYLFLRTSEFLWQEGHCAHATHEESTEMVLKALEWYRSTYEDYYAMPCILGTKSQSEKFAGADATYTVESLMPDGKALQACTSHDLGQNFSKPQNISFQDTEGKSQFVWQNSWGFSTRSIGGLIMVHGDDNGLVLPPKVAAYQIVIVPISKGEAKSEKMERYITHIADILTKDGMRVHIDNREGMTPGRKFNDWEVKGVPLRFEIGEREVLEEKVTIVDRDTGHKGTMPLDDAFTVEVEFMLDKMQKRLFDKAKKFSDENTHTVDSYDEFKKIMEGPRGFLRAFWCEDAICETKIKEETKATTRCKPLDAKEEDGKCIHCGKAAKFRWYFAQAY
jgi:prolyl-tRNA synthetase